MAVKNLKATTKVANTKVTFTVRTPWHEDDIYIVGNLDKLGGWNPKNAIKCDYDEATNEYFVTKLLSIGENIEFKILKGKDWCFVEKGYFGDEIQNRTFKVGKGTNVLIEVSKFS